MNSRILSRQYVERQFDNHIPRLFHILPSPSSLPSHTPLTLPPHLVFRLLSIPILCRACIYLKRPWAFFNIKTQSFPRSPLIAGLVFTPGSLTACSFQPRTAPQQHYVLAYFDSYARAAANFQHWAASDTKLLSRFGMKSVYCLQRKTLVLQPNLNFEIAVGHKTLNLIPITIDRGGYSNIPHVLYYCLCLINFAETFTTKAFRLTATNQSHKPSIWLYNFSYRSVISCKIVM